MSRVSFNETRKLSTRTTPPTTRRPRNAKLNHSFCTRLDSAGRIPPAWNRFGGVVLSPTMFFTRVEFVAWMGLKILRLVWISTLIGSAQKNIATNVEERDT